MISQLMGDFGIISELFYENCIFINSDKCYFLTVGFNQPFLEFSFNDITIKNATGKKNFWIVINSKLNARFKIINKKANQKLSALEKIKMKNP